MQDPVSKFNKMLKFLKSSLFELRRSIKGLVVMSSDLEALAELAPSTVERLGVPAGFNLRGCVSIVYTKSLQVK